MTEHDEYDSTSTSSIPSFRFKYDVFLSFRGEDTRHTFTNRLYQRLVQNGVRTFRDDDELERGEEIAPSLVEAIQDSAAAIAVISRRYADSRWCLEELAMIVECRRLLLPVFYQVDPSDVRRQRGPFEEDFLVLENRFGEKVVRWRNALEKAGSIAGWDSKLWEEEELIQSLVKRVLAKLSNTPLGVAKYPVGLNSHLEELMNIMDVKANGVLFLGIYGMGGAGKTTLARALYNKFVIYFKRRSFISNVRETVRIEDGLVILQNKLISDLSQREASEDSRGIITIRELIHEEPVLIVLDDIDDLKQLEDLVGNNRQWFYEGSRIIITTRDKEAIPERIVDAFYEMEGLKSPEAFELFSYHAFGRGKPTKDFVDLSEKIVTLTGGLPLALEVLGSVFYDKRRRKDWLEALKKLEQVRPGELQDVLKISFDSLDQQEKCAFLDIACFFIDIKIKREDAVYILKGYGFSGETLVMSLVAKSLIKIIESDTLWMHDQLKDMGKQIVQDENNDIGMRSRLWDYNDIMNVLKNKKGTRSVEGIALDIGKTLDDLNNKDIHPKNFRKKTPFSSFTCYLKKDFKTKFHQEAENKKAIVLHAKSFIPMVNLRFLRIDDAQLEGSFKLMPAELKCLQWKRCSLRALPSQFRMQHLAFLDLSESKIEQPWEESLYNLQNSNNRAGKLLVMNLQGCQQLTYLPDLSLHSALEKLNLERCMALVKLHKSVGDLKKLLHLNLNGCSNLVEFPSDVSGLKHLEIFVLTGCSKLKELPDDLRSMGCLREFLIDDTAITELPNSIFHLKRLEIFSLRECRSLKQLPPSIGTLNSLKELHLDGSGLEGIPSSISSLTELEMLSLMRCKALTTLPDAIGNLKSLLKLFLDGSAIIELPTSIGSLSHLKHLSVGRCQSLTALPDTICGLESLIEFSLEGSSIAKITDHIGCCRMIEKLNMRSCTSISVLSESIGNLLSLTALVLDKVMITELPESIGMLERLRTLQLNECKQLQRLPSSIGNLKNLCYFLMALTSVSELPDEFEKLSSLKILKMGKKSYALSPQNSGKQVLAAASTSQQKVIPKSFSNLSSLQQLDICAWNFCGGIPDEFEKLSSLEELNLSYNDFFSLPSSLRGLSILKKLSLSYCKEIKILPPLPSSLVELNCANCSKLESISDLTSLTSLRELNLTNCIKIIDIPGLQCLKSLRSLNMGGCNTCFPAVKERLAKVALKHLFYLCIPGSTIPDWFVPELPRFASHRNRDIKSIIIAVVISLDQQTTDRYRNKLPAIVDIKLEYYKQDDPRPEFYRVLKLMGVPATNEDHLYLCRYYEFHPPVFRLKDGYRIQIAMRETPLFSGLRLKKHGFHLIFENDDFDEDDEEFLDESQRSVSWKLAKFIGSLQTSCTIAPASTST